MSITRVCGKIIGRFDNNTNPTPEMIQKSNEYRELFKDIEEKIHKNICCSDEKYKAIDKLEEALMWLNKAIYHYQDGGKSEYREVIKNDSK